MKEIKLRECPCCGGESKFRNIDGVSGRPISVCAWNYGISENYRSNRKRR